MTDAEKIKNALGTLLYSWGSDTPNEVIWGLNELVQFFSEKYDTSLIDFKTVDEDYNIEDNTYWRKFQEENPELELDTDWNSFSADALAEFISEKLKDK